MNATAMTEEETLLGATLDGAYRITRLLAKGGMSAVYEAVQLRLHQRVAVKVMARELASNPEALLRFQREAEITSRLRHPHLVTVMDFGTAPAGQPYLVMEYLEGIDLDRRIRAGGPLPLGAVVSITRQVASALAAAHEQGIVHRDLKPANVFLVELPGEPDFAKILDFGISKVRAASTQLTKASAVIGTPNYMAPEQATGMLDEIDQRTDQWSLACIAWEMLAGRPPFAGDDMSAVFYQVIHLDPPPLGQRAPDVPAAVEAVLRRALSKTTTERFPSIRDFAGALADAADAPSATPAPAGAAWVERRQARQERRRVEPAGPAAGPQVPDDDLAAAAVASFGRKSRRLYAIAAVAAGLVIGALVSLRWNPPAKATVRPEPAPAVVAAAPEVPSPAAAATTPTAPSATAAARPEPAGPAAMPASPPVRPGKPRPTARTARVRDAEDPFAPTPRPGTHRPARAARPVDDSLDPFAPTRPAGKPARAKADVDFVDPFGA